MMRCCHSYATLQKRLGRLRCGGTGHERQSVVQDQQTDFDEPDGRQRAQLVDKGHFAPVNSHLHLLWSQRGRNFGFHVVAAILGHLVETKHVRREGTLQRQNTHWGQNDKAYHHDHHQPVVNLEIRPALELHAT